jgi:hypothetical protein
MNKMNVSMVIVAFSMIWGVQAQKSAGKVNPAAATQKTVGVADFSGGATASSGLAITYTSSNTAVATVSGNIVTIVGAGTATITASQVGDNNYNAATDVTRDLVVLNPPLYLNNFTGVAACPTNGNTPSVPANATGDPMSRSTITCTTLANMFNSTTLNNTASISNTSYIQFAVKANTGYQLNVKSLLSVYIYIFFAIFTKYINLTSNRPYLVIQN